MKRCVLIFIPLLLFSCKKEVPNELLDFTGDYHLYYIQLSGVEYWVQDDLDFSVGLRVRDNMSIETFIDGERFKRYKYLSIKNNSGLRIEALYEGDFNENVLFTFHKSGRIETKEFPFPNEINIFKK